ncbi:hypothetical protein ABPG74_013360, partial [Tetrahymena malaccensis]
IQSEFDKKSLGLYFICEEINILEKDLMFFRIGLPNYLNFGFILLKTETLKQEYIQQIKFYISQLKKIIQDKLVSQLQATRQQVQNFTERLQKNPVTIKDYSEISDYLSSQAILEQYTDLQNQINYINDLMKVSDEYSLEISFETIQMQVESRSWILQLRNIEQEPKFEKTLKESIANLLANFEKQKTFSDELKQQGSLDNIYVLSSQTKSLKNELDEIYQKAQELNQYENYLKMNPITNFCEIEICLNDLMKYYDLWDFAERWKLRYEEWTTRPLVFMESKEVVDTLNEGFQLLPDLILDFKDNPLFITIIRQLEEEIQKFNTIEIELQKIEGILKDTFLRTLPYYLDVSSEFTFKIIKNTSDVIKNLSEAKFRANILIKNLSFVDVFKKRMNSVHKLARNGKKVIKIMNKVQNTLLDYISLFVYLESIVNYIQFHKVLSNNLKKQQNQLDEVLLLEDKINIDISKGIENAIEGQMKLENSMRYFLRKQFLKNTQTLTRLGLDYNEIYRLLHLKNEIIFQIAYLNIDICFYHDLTTTILNSEENDEVPDLNLGDFLQKIRIYMQNFINNQISLGLSKNELLKFSGLVMQSLNHQNILQRFIDQKVDTLASFDYLGLPKFSVEVETNQILKILQQNKHSQKENPLLQLNQQEIIQHMLKSAKLALDNRESTDYPNLSENSEFFYYFSLIDNPELINVNLMCMNYKRGYTWEFIAGDHYTFVNTYQTERMLFNIIGAISTNTSILIRGPQSSGKQSTVSYLATILAKPYFTWKFSDQNDFSSLNQVLIGTAQGGYITLIQNCEYLNVGMISTLANIIFQIRNSCISKVDILDSNNCPIKVSEHWGLYASFTVRQDSQVLQFSQIPNILESFRTVSIVQPDIQTILAAKLTLMNFIKPTETAQRLHVFFQLFSSSLSNSHFLVDSFKQLDVITLDQVSQTEFNQHLFNPNMSTIMKIISHAEYFLFEKKVSNEDEIENYTLLYSAINAYYAHALSQFHLKLLNNLFIKMFPESQVSEGYLFKDFQDDGANEEEEAVDGKQKTVQILQTPQVSSSTLQQNKDDNRDDDFEQHIIDYFQKVHKIKPSERFIDTILDMIFNININKTILVVGLNSKVKDYALNAAAFVSSLIEKAQFYKHYITLDANDYTFLMGEHVDGVWRKGILQQLLDSITYMSENSLYSEVLTQYYRSNYLSFITSQANPLDPHNKIQNLKSKSIESNLFLKKNQQSKTKSPETILTLKDWIIFETSNTNFKGNQSKFIDQMIKSIHQRILFFDNGQQIKLQNTLKLILNLDSLDNITPGCLGNFQIFNFGYNNYIQKNNNFNGSNVVSQGFHWSIKNDFERWLDTLISQNKFFNYCEKILRTCYVYLFEPILVFLKDSLEQTSSGEAKKIFNNPGAIVDIILHQQQNFLSILEIFINEFRKTMVALGKYAITSNSSTMKDVRSKAFYTFISLQNKKQASPIKNADLDDSQHQLNTDASYLEKEFRAPVESIFLFSIVQGMCSSYINPNFLSQLTEHCLGCVKKLKLAHENIFSSQFKACQNFSKLLKQNKSLSVLDLIYDISELAWVRISDFKIPENIPLLDNSLSNDHLELSEIIRLNKNALQVEEMKKLMENNNEIVYQLPKQEKQVVYLSAPFKMTKYLIDYLMVCNYSSRKLFSEDFSVNLIFKSLFHQLSNFLILSYIHKKFTELGSCLREMFMLKFPDMNGDHLTGIFMEILKASPMFNTKEKMQANILAVDFLQKQLAKFAHNYMSSIPKLTQITQIFKINFNINKVLTLIASTLSHQQIVQNGQLNESLFEQMWTYILDTCFLDSLPWNKNPIFLEKLKNSQKTNAKNQFIFNLLKDNLSDSGSDEEFDNIQISSPLKKGSLSVTQNQNIPNLNVNTEVQQTQKKAIEIQNFLVETLYSPKKTNLQQMEFNVSEKDIKSKLGGFKPNLVENHMIYILKQKLKDYISFIIEINPDNYKEYLILKDQIPKSFTHFNDHFSFLQKDNQKKSSEQDDIYKLINEPATQEIQNKFWQTEKGVSELFEINYFQTSIKSQKEIEFYVPHLARLIQNNLQSTITQISSKKNVSQIINIDMIKQPINDKLKQLLEELLNYKMKYIDLKKQYESLQKLHETYKNFSSYKMNYSKLQISQDKEKVQREGKRKSSINNHLYNPIDQKLVQSEYQSTQTSKVMNQPNLSSRRFNRSGSNDIHQSQDEQKMMESHRMYIEEVKDEKNEILHKLETAKKSYQNAFKNFRYINLLLCQLLKTIHYYRQECNPILTFQDGELAKYAYDIALYSLSALKYPACYRENLFDVLLQQNKKLNIPFYKVMLESPTTYLEQLINGTDLGINIINEYSLINFLIGVDLLPLCITDETGLYLQYLQNLCTQKQKRTMHIEYNTVDDDSLENVENAILKGSYLVLHNPDETLKKFFSSFVYDNILNTFYSAEKEKFIKGEIFKREVLSKQDYSLEKILPIISKLSLSEKDSWNQLIQLLPHHIINQAATKEGFADHFAEDDQLLQIGQVSNEFIMKNLEDVEKDQLMLNFQNADLGNSIDLEKSNSSMGSKQGGDLRKKSKNFKEIYGDVSLHSQIGQQLQSMKDEDQELQSSQYQRQSSFKRQQTSKEKNLQLKKQNTVFSQVSQAESDAMASSNDLENNLPQYCFFNFEILDFQSNNSLSPEYPSQKLMNIASKFKILVEILYGLKLSYKEVVTQIEKEDSSIKYSEENFLLVFKQVSDCLKLNQISNYQTNQFNKRFASMSYHYLYCTLREDHQTVWQLTLSFFFQMSALTDKKQINYSYLQQKVLLEQRVKPIQNLVFSKLSTNRYWDSFITSLVDLYGQIRRDSTNKAQEPKSPTSQQLIQKSSFYSKKNIMQEFNLDQIQESDSNFANNFKGKDHYQVQKREKINIEQSQEYIQDANSQQDEDDQSLESEMDAKQEQLQQKDMSQQQNQKIDSQISENQLNNQQQTIKQIKTETPSLNEVQQNTYQRLMDDANSDEDEFEENKEIILENKDSNKESVQKITKAMSVYYDNKGNEVAKKQSEKNLNFLESEVFLQDDGLMESDLNIQKENKQEGEEEDQFQIKKLLQTKVSQIDEQEQEQSLIQSQQLKHETNNLNTCSQDLNKQEDSLKHMEDEGQQMLAESSSNKITTNKMNTLLQSNSQNENQTQDLAQQEINIEQNNLEMSNLQLDEMKISSKEYLNASQQNYEDQNNSENTPSRSKQYSFCSSVVGSPNDYMVKEEDFYSPLPQKQNSVKLVHQSNFSIQFKEQKRISQQIIDIPNVRNQDVQDKDYMIRMEQEFNLNSEYGGLNKMEKVGSQKQFDLQKLQKKSQQDQEEQESKTKNKEMSSDINQFNMIDKMDSIVQLAKENIYIKRHALGLPVIKSKFDNLRYDNNLMWFGINSYKAIFHSSQVLRSKELQNTLTSLQIEKDLWKSVFFLSHSEILRDENNYLDKMKDKLGDINLSVFLKFFRPDILENIINVYSTKQLSKFFVSHTKTNLNAHSRANWYNKPTVIFYGHLNKTINELLELKACKQSPTIKVKRIPLGSISNKVIKQELNNASIKGDWVVLENIKSVPYDQLGQLIKIINNALNNNQNKNEYFKVWITQQQMNKSYQLNEKPGIVQTHRNNSQTLLQQFFFNCFKMFINRPDSIKSNLSVLYTLEIHEYLAFVEKKVTQALPTNYNFSTLGKQLQSPIHEAIKYRFQKQKRHENINYSYNIHSVFIDRIALREKNKHAVNMLEKFSNKIKFNIFFIFSILRSRQKYHRKIAEYYQQSELLFFSDLDLLYVVEDGFHFLNYYSINPSLFFRNYLKLIFSEEMPYNAHSTWTIASMRDLLEELVFKGVDKQTIYASGDQKYTLFFEQPNQSTEETIFKTINDLPNLDSPQTIEISPNTEIQYCFNRSQRLMARIHKKVQLQEQLGKEAEMLRELKDQIAQTSEDKESLSDVSLVSTNDKNLQLGDSDDFTLQQVSQIYAYWINHIDLLGKNMTIIQKIQQIQSEFKILFEKSQNLDLFASKFTNNDIQEENDSDSDSSSEMSEDQNIQQAKLSKLSKNTFQIKLRRNKDSNSSFDSSFSDSKNEQENQYQKGKSVSPQKQNFADDQNLKKDLQKWLSDKPLHAAPVISRKSNLLNSIEKSETQLSTNRLSSPKIKQSLKQPSIANIMLGNLQSAPQLNLKMNHRKSVAALASPHRQSVFFGKQFIVENTLNTPSPNLNSPSKNSYSQQSPLITSSPIFQLRKESVFVKQSNSIASNLIKVNTQEQLSSSNRVSDSIQLFNSQTNNSKDSNQAVFNSTLQNELQIAKSLLKRIITDLDGVIQYVLYRQSSFSQQEKSLLQTGFLKTSEQEAILINILENKVPQNWWVQSFLIRENDLQQYMKYLVLKLETLKLILEERRCKMYPVIQLDSMFDPFFLISSYLTHKSAELNVSIFDLKIECEIQKKPSVQQPTDGSMLINGFFIKNGRLNEHALDIEHAREFEFKIPNMKIMVKKKIYKNNFYKNYLAHVSMNFVDDSLYDFEGTYYAQNQFINGTKKVQKSEFAGKKASSDSKQYVVRLPVVNSLTNHLFNSFPMRIYFYFRSSKPQEFWVKRSTEIYLQQEFL